MKEVYPCTITMDRYSGTYSNAKWLAFALDPWDLPDEVGGGDPEEESFWRSHNQDEFPVGKGRTPQEAYEDLQKRHWSNVIEL